MNDLNVALAAIALLVLLFGLLAGLLRGKVQVLSEPMAALGLGIALGPVGLDLLRLDAWGEPKHILEQVARVALAVSVMATALRLPSRYFRRHVRTMALILGPGMLLMWLASGVLGYLFFDVGIWTALLLGAIVTPTDPVIAGTIVAGDVAERDLPERIRHFLSGEAGANDGGAYPLTLLCIFMLQRPPGEALTHWLTATVLWDVGGAVAIGVAVGWAAGRIQNWSKQHDFLEATSLTTVTVALSLLVLAAVKLSGSDGILAVFAAGLMFRTVTDQQDEVREENVQDAVNRLFGYPIFVFFGLALPWQAWSEYGWLGAAFVAAVLLLRRLPMMAALAPLTPPLRSRSDVWFAGWFGPIGVAAIYYATYADRMVHDERMWTVASLVVFGSVIAHGVTSTPFADLYRRASERTGDGG